MLKAALAGCGGVSRWTLNVARQSKEFTVEAIQDVDPAALKRMGESYGIVRRTTAFQDLLSADIDFVILNTPNHVHHDQLEAALKADKPCLVQKPVARSVQEGREMLAMVKRFHHLKVGVSMMELGNPLYHQLHAMIHAGVIGAPCLWQSSFAHDMFLHSPPDKADWRRHPDQVGGAAFIQLAVHHCNLAAWLLGQPIVSVCAQTESRHTVFEWDESTVAAVKFGGGVVGSITASYATTGIQVAVQGTQGYLRIFNDTLLMKGHKSFEGEWFKYLQPGKEMVVNMQALQGVIAANQGREDIHNQFARWVAKNEPFPCPLEDGIRDLKVVEAVYQSAKEGKTVSIH